MFFLALFHQGIASRYGVGLLCGRGKNRKGDDVPRWEIKRWGGGGGGDH